MDYGLFTMPSHPPERGLFDGHQWDLQQLRWADELGFIQALERFHPRLAGHQQVTDAYLLGLAIRKKGKLATMDRGVLALLPEKSRERDFVELI